MNDLVFIVGAVFAGGVLSPILGYLRAKKDEQEQFDWGSFVASVLIAAIAGLIVAGMYYSQPAIALPDIINAFVAGFGADKIVKNVIGI